MLGSSTLARLSGYARPRAIISLISQHGRLSEATTVPAGGRVSLCPARIPLIIARGWAARVREGGQGRVQILNFLLPGDSLVSGGEGGTPKVDRVVALTPLQIVPVTGLEPDSAGSTRSLEAFCRSSAAEEVNLVLDHVMRLGQQTALERTAHLLLELMSRLAAVRLADNGVFVLPVKQDCLAQALGMSAVHLNRTLQKLKTDGLISMRGSRVAILRPDRLQRLCAYGCEEDGVAQALAS